MANYNLANYELTHQTFLPENDGLSLNLTIPPDTVIVLGNHMASSIYRNDGRLGDAGRKARGVANRIGCPVIAYNHMGTGPGAPEIIVGPENANEVAKYTGEKIGEIVNDFGFKHVILGGNSSDGTASAGLAASETMPVTHLSVMDPPGMHEISLARGFTRWLHFNLRTEREGPQLKRPPDDVLEEATGFAAAAFRQDSKAYRRLWESRQAAVWLENIASDMGHIAVRLDIPENTFTGSPEANRALTADLMRRRQELAKHNPDTMPLDAVIVEGRYHSHYENFRVYASCIAKVIDPKFSGFDF
jgi:hypothetical protein